MHTRNYSPTLLIPQLLHNMPTRPFQHNMPTKRFLLLSKHSKCMILKLRGMKLMSMRQKWHMMQNKHKMPTMRKMQNRHKMHSMNLMPKTNLTNSMPMRNLTRHWPRMTKWQSLTVMQTKSLRHIMNHLLVLKNLKNLPIGTKSPLPIGKRRKNWMLLKMPMHKGNWMRQ